MCFRMVKISQPTPYRMATGRVSRRPTSADKAKASGQPLLIQNGTLRAGDVGLAAGPNLLARCTCAIGG